MNKQEMFLWIVQTTLMSYSVFLATKPENQDPEVRYSNAHRFSHAGILGLAGDAVAASKRIPENLSAREAACDFCGFMLKMYSDEEGRACPRWFAELKE